MSDGREQASSEEEITDRGDRTAATVVGTPAVRLGGLPAGAHVGRYEIVEVLGTGGMGVVYRAHDAQLSRDVALKLLHEHHQFEPEAKEQQVRLLREAQALAQLSHPNVVAAYDVGTYEGTMFVAMELIAGVSLRDWLKTPRPRREVLRVVLAAGRGLAAAHAAGVTHRDFKPENVMVSPDGRVRVVDFGLARGAGAADEPDVPAPTETAGTIDDGVTASTSRSTTSSSSLLASDLTQTGVSMGTPGYMAPEHLLGGAADARGDQYGYAATVFRALTGRKVYETATLDLYRLAVVAGDRVPWPHAVPRRIRRIVDRGLALKPADRYPSLTKMVDALERAAAGPRTLFLAVGALALVATTTVVLVRSSQDREISCRSDAASFAGIWDAPRRTAIEQAFTATHVSHAATTFALVAKRLDDYEARWHAMREVACQAARVRGQESEAVLGLRRACLDRKLEQASALAGLFAEADTALVESAVNAVQGLDTFDECADVPALLGEAEHLPADPAARAKIVRIRDGLERVGALTLGGRWDVGLAEATTLLAAAGRVGHEPTIARARYQLALLQIRNNHSVDSDVNLGEALRLAGRARLDELVAQISTNMLGNLKLQKRIVEARALLPLVESNLERVPQREDLRAQFLTIRGNILAETAGADAALPSLIEARAIYERLADPALARVFDALGNVYFLKEDRKASIDAYQRAVAVTKERLGPSHPDMLMALNNLASTAAELGDRALTETTLAQSRAVADELPADNFNRPYIIAIEGVMLETVGDHVAAVPRFRRGLAEWEAAFGVGSVEAAVMHFHLGTCLFATGERSEAIAQMERTVAIRRAKGAAPADTVNAMFSLAKMLATEPADRRRALTLAQDALAMMRSDPGGDTAVIKQITNWLAAPPR